MYQIKFDLKDVEIDNFETGCDPASHMILDNELVYIGFTMRELINEVKLQFNVTEENMSFNSCDEIGRLDVQVYENYDGDNINTDVNNPDSVIGSAWRAGKMKVYLATYTGTVEKVEVVNLRKYIK